MGSPSGSKEPPPMSSGVRATSQGSMAATVGVPAHRYREVT